MTHFDDQGKFDVLNLTRVLEMTSSPLCSSSCQLFVYESESFPYLTSMILRSKGFSKITHFIITMPYCFDGSRSVIPVTRAGHVLISEPTMNTILSLRFLWRKF